MPLLSCFCGSPGWLRARRRTNKAATIAVLGLDNAGKTTVVSCLKGEPDGSTTPSIGFSTERAEVSGFSVQLYDIGGGRNIRRIWRTYFADLHGLVYVVDAADPARREESREALAQALSHAHLQGKPLLVLANKQDLPAAAPAHEIALALGLPELRDLQFNIVACTARPGGGGGSGPVDPAIANGLKWLLGCIEGRYPQLALRVQQESEQVRQAEQRLRRERMERAQRAREEQQRQEQVAAAAESTPVTAFDCSDEGGAEVEAARAGGGSSSSKARAAPATLAGAVPAGASGSASAAVTPFAGPQQQQAWAAPAAHLRTSISSSVRGSRTDLGGVDVQPPGATAVLPTGQSLLQAARSLERQLSGAADVRHSTRGTSLLAVMEGSRSHNASGSQVLHRLPSSSGRLSCSSSSMQLGQEQRAGAEPSGDVQVLACTRRSSASLAEQAALARNASLGGSTASNRGLHAASASQAAPPAGKLPPLLAPLSALRASFSQVERSCTADGAAAAAGQQAHHPGGSLSSSVSGLFGRSSVSSMSVPAAGDDGADGAVIATVARAGAAPPSGKGAAGDGDSDVSGVGRSLVAALSASGQRVSNTAVLPMLG